MGNSKKSRRKNPANDNGVDLLSLAFNMPTRRDFERADREASQSQIQTQSIRVRCDAGEDESSDAESSTTSQASVTKPATQVVDETPKARKSSKSRHQHQVKERKTTSRAPTQKNRPKAPDQVKVPLLTRRLSKRDSSETPKARERSASSPATLRAPSPAVSIPSSATFPCAMTNHFQNAAAITSSHASIRPLQPSIGGGGAQPQQFYQPMFAFSPASAHPPTQYYSAVVNGPISGCTQHVPFSMSSLPSTPTKTSSQQPNLISQQVQQIQSKLDEVVMRLSQHPEDVTLKGNLSALQTELNTRLNLLLGIEDQKGSNVSDASEPHSLKMTSSALQPAVAQKERSPRRKVRHHLCTGCGKVRSADYHSKRPVISGSKPSKNYCDDCFEEKVERGGFDHHFCYGCGAARSKDFHQNHPISKEDKPFPNYCSICVEEIRSSETIADISMVNFTPGNRSQKGKTSSETERDQLRSNQPIDLFQSRQEFGNIENQPHVLLFSAHGDKSGEIDHHTQKKFPHPLKISTRGSQLSPSNSSPDSPYYPVRHTGASQRRAQRSPLTSPGSQYCTSPDTPITLKYQPPYVEDVISPIQEAAAPEIDYQSQSTPGRQNFQHESLRRSTKESSPDISHEGSEESTEGQASTDDSSHSTGSKSVKFRPKVDIRFSDSRTSSNASSHAKILEEDIKPDDDTIPSRVGIYGTSPVKSRNGYYPRALDSQQFSSSLAAESGYVEAAPERGYRGAFSKDSPASSWMPPTSSAGGSHWYSRPSLSHSTTPLSPSVEGFKGYKPGERSTFNYGSGGGNGSENSPPPLRAAQSPFSSASPDTTKERKSQKTPLSPSSDSQSQIGPESPNNSWKYYTSPFGGGQKAESTFKKTSPWSNFSFRFDTECHTMQDDSSFSQSAFSDYSQPSSNPYYEPRKRTFPDLNDYCSFTTQTRRTPGKWANDYQGATKPKAKPYWIPEPIVEEPDSPESSPEKKSNMLEFNEIDISPATASTLATNSSPDSINDDMAKSAGPEVKVGDDSDKENSPSNNNHKMSSLH